MSRRFQLTSYFAVLVSANMSASSLANAQATASINKVSWMAGCWMRATATSTVEEQWMAPRGNALIGMSRTANATTVREYEFLRVFSAGDTLVYAASPSGQAYTEFRSKTIGDREVVFENLKHDFPQRIGYKAIGRDSLLAYIEGPNNGTNRRINFPFARATCPTGAP